MASAEGGVERVVPLASPEEMHEFSRILRLNFARLLHDEHLWLSAFDPASQRGRAAMNGDPCRAHFTRLQRVAVAFLVILMHMLASALFYGRRVEKPGEIQGFLFGICNCTSILIVSVLCTVCKDYILYSAGNRNLKSIFIKLKSGL